MNLETEHLDRAPAPRKHYRRIVVGELALGLGVAGSYAKGNMCQSGEVLSAMMDIHCDTGICSVPKDLESIPRTHSMFHSIAVPDT